MSWPPTLIFIPSPNTLFNSPISPSHIIHTLISTDSPPHLDLLYTTMVHVSRIAPPKLAPKVVSLPRFVNADPDGPWSHN
jgi:hypothetical protein